MVMQSSSWLGGTKNPGVHGPSPTLLPPLYCGVHGLSPTLSPLLFCGVNGPSPTL